MKVSRAPFPWFLSALNSQRQAVLKLVVSQSTQSRGKVPACPTWKTLLPLLKAEIANLAKTINKVTGFFGGNICADSGLDLSNGFKLDVNAVLTLFDKDLVNVSIIELVKNVEPSVASVITAIQVVFGEAIKTAMNSAKGCTASAS